MTPAEQKARDAVRAGLEAQKRGLEQQLQGAEDRVGALERELEMCQRYFPFMRRSRDEAVKELARVRKEVAEVWAANGQLSIARDEAVKREKALREALERIAAQRDGLPTSGLAEIARAALDQSGKP